MSKRLSALMASTLLASSLVLGACGSPASSASSDDTSKEETAQTTESTSAAESTSEAEKTVVDPARAFVGDWKLAKATVGGVTIMGDFTAMTGSEEGMALSVGGEGSGTMTFGEDSNEFRWEVKDEDTIILMPVDSESETQVEVSYDAENEAVVMHMEDETFSGDLTFTADGSLKESSIDVSEAAAVTSIDQIVGTWKMCGVSMGDMLVVGAAEDLSSFSGDAFDASLSIGKDGSIETAESEEGVKVTVDENGATLSASSLSIPLTVTDDYLVLDFSKTLEGSSFCLIYEK